MAGLLCAGVLLWLSAMGALVFAGERSRRWIGCGGTVIGSLCGAWAVIGAMGGWLDAGPVQVMGPLGTPLIWGIDPLSAFFLAVIFVLSALIGGYGIGYLRHQPRLASSVAFFPLLVCAMAAVVVARDGLSFLVAWELMSLCSLFLVVTEHELLHIRRAGWLYLVATHCAAAFLFLFFFLLARQTGSLAFHDFVAIDRLPALLAGGLFLCALIGFGTKAGLFPLHIWLPHAHPAAPSYISALMSGVMIKTGIYGLLRAVTFLGTPPLWWGEALLLLGICSAVLGILYALVQDDLKRFLAYSSVEHIGIIVAGIGLWLIGVNRQQPALAAFGLSGALLHVVNHAVCKGLLFLSAGSAVHAAHTRSLHLLGGLLRRMPVTGGCFVLGAMAICGLPPLNGFVSEWLLYVGFFRGSFSLTHFSLFLAIAGIVGLALVSGLAIAGFAKVIGAGFLGTSRREREEVLHDSSRWMVVPLGLLAFGCGGLACFPQPVIWCVRSIMATFGPLGTIPLVGMAELPIALDSVVPIQWILLALIGVFLPVALFIHRRVRRPVTWDCGYAHPSARMQYSAASFVEPLAAIFRPLFRPAVTIKGHATLFTPVERYAEDLTDLAERVLFHPVGERGARLFAWLRGLQGHTIQGYLALMFAMLLLLIVWEVSIGF